MMVTKFSLQIQDSKRLGWPAGALKHTIILSKALIIKINIDWKMKHDNIVEWGHNNHEKTTFNPNMSRQSFHASFFCRSNPTQVHSLTNSGKGVFPPGYPAGHLQNHKSSHSNSSSTARHANLRNRTTSEGTHEVRN